MEERETEAPLAMTDIEEQLRGEGGRALRDTMMARLAAREARLEAAVREGLPPDDFAKAEPVLRGLRAAKHLLSNFPATEY